MAFAGLLATGLQAATADTPGRPNIILMLADDQGWDGLSVEMARGVAGSQAEFAQTPNLERQIGRAHV